MTAAADTDPSAPPATDDTRAACSPCRGSGHVVSNLGGEPSTHPCPWCEGSGTFLAEHDAQAARRHALAAGDGRAGDGAASS